MGNKYPKVQVGQEKNQKVESNLLLSCRPLAPVEAPDLKTVRPHFGPSGFGLGSETCWEVEDPSVTRAVAFESLCVP